MNRIPGNRLKLASAVSSVAVILILIGFTAFPKDAAPAALSVTNRSASATFVWHENNSGFIQGGFSKLPAVVSSFHRGNSSEASAFDLTTWFGTTYWPPQKGPYSNGRLWYGIEGFVNGSILQGIKATSLTLRLYYNINTTDPIHSLDVFPDNPISLQHPYINVTNLVNFSNYMRAVTWNERENMTSITVALLNDTPHTSDYQFSFSFYIQPYPAPLNYTTHDAMNVIASLNGLDKNITCSMSLQVNTIWES